MTCPRCGNTATGSFCSTCGASLGAVACAQCGTGLSAGAKFCHACGRSVAGPGRGLPAWFPWALVALLTVGLIVVAVVRTGPSVSAPTPVPGPGAEAQVPPAFRGPDISAMTPRQRADALFNRVMGAYERGLEDSVAFFAPMGLAAYRLLGELDADAHYHVGLIQLAAGEPAAARAHADSIAAEAPNHLLASLLLLEAARASGDADAERAAARAFLRHYEAEMAMNRPEYRDHAPNLERYRRELESRG